MKVMDAEQAEELPDVDQRVFLHDVSWDVYKALDAARGESAVPRITYLDGVVELMSPGISHERIKKTLARLVEAFADARDLDLRGYGSWTLKKKRKKRGAEADECYILGPGPEDRKGKRVPDLAIEVVWTSGGIDKLAVYRGLGVREVWIWKKGRIAVFVLEDGEYREVERSALLPDLDIALIGRLALLEDQRQAVKTLRAALRGEPDPGTPGRAP